ncbi:hypothetical protein A260_15578 [Pseudomonas syringae pv. actinidiae ICMP 19068]|nr:hypothetical protein A260_15578 [Pseudomonas syringae pv. actinidiae ICMP 19068]
MKVVPWRAVGALLILLALAGALYVAYRHGVTVTDLAWQAKWAEQVSAQSEAVATTTTEYRTEEQRRQKAANQVANDARQEQTAALTDAAVADAAGDRLRVEAGRLAAPELPNEARQPPAPPWCSPTCSAGLTRERENWQRLMTNPE